MSNNLTSEQQNNLQLFQEISQISDVELCVDILRENHWNVETAVDAFVQGRRTRSTPQAPPGGGRINQNNLVASSTSSSRAQSVISREGQLNIFERILSSMRWLFQSRPISLNPEADTRNFISDFDANYGSNHPTFIESTYQQAVDLAFRSSKFLLIYLHSPLHEDSNRFCRLDITILFVLKFVFLIFLCNSGVRCVHRLLKDSQMKIFWFGQGRFGMLKHMD